MKNLIFLLALLTCEEISMAQDRKRLPAPVNSKEHTDYSNASQKVTANYLTLSVLIRNAETGNAITGTDLEIRDASNKVIKTAFDTDKNVYQALVSMGKTLVLSASGKGYQPAEMKLDSISENKEIVINLSEIKHSVLKIAVRDFQGVPLPSSVTLTYTGSKTSQTYEVKTGTLEKIFTEPAELDVTAFEQGYTSVTKRLKIEIIPGGKTYEFEAKLDRITYVMILKAVDFETGQEVSGVTFTLKDLRNGIELTSGTGADAGKEIVVPGKGKYEITCSADGYNPHTLQLDVNKEKNEALFKMQKKAKPVSPAAIPLTDKSTGEELKAKSIQEREKSVVQEKLFNANVAGASTKTTKTVETAAFGALKKGEAITLNNIFFDQSSPVLRKESFIELDKLAEVLTNNPELRIEIRGHTDNTGNFDANVKLSKERCESVVNYLFEKGISKSRLQYVGRGPVDAVAPNTTEENKKKNRRVEFIVL